MDSPLPRVAIAVPSGDMVHADFAMAYAQLCMASAALQLRLITVKSSIVAQARNNGVELAKNFGADFIFFLDSDMLFPPTALFSSPASQERHRRRNLPKRVAPFEISAPSSPSSRPFFRATFLKCNAFQPAAC